MVNSFWYANSVKTYQFKANDSEIEPYPLSLVNILKDFTVNSMKKTGLKGKMYIFSVSYDTIDTNDILNIYKCSIKKRDFL